MIGRLISAALALIPNIRALIVHNLFLFLAGVSCACIPFCTDFLTMAISNFCYGMFMGKFWEPTAHDRLVSCHVLNDEYIVIMIGTGFFHDKN